MDSLPELRFERAKGRGKLGEAILLEDFMQNELKENSTPHVQRLFECMKQADHLIRNDSSLDQLYKKVDNVIARL